MNPFIFSAILPHSIIAFNFPGIDSFFRFQAGKGILAVTHSILATAAAAALDLMVPSMRISCILDSDIFIFLMFCMHGYV